MGAREEVVVAKVLDGVKVILVQAQQRDIGFEDIAACDTSPDGKCRIEQGFGFGGFEILTNQRQTGVGAEVVGELFANEVGHDRVHLRGEQNFTIMTKITVIEILHLNAYISEVINIEVYLVTIDIVMRFHS